ncbi:hypothetical protein HMPREF9530_00125 [Escherichia coli MS 21-1]|uniref:hypothetical protein n=1 Tax=Escherichia coli TaxID=562 RepID=UPI0001DC64D2|nr:hypothetical protein [Escherichia coli]EFK23211.1 hypothetical protein HMPREF9530_00125 [Escherichia coli MS 21-1]
MRISNIEWLKKRIGFIRKLGEQTARQRQIIDLLDNEAGLTEQERKLLRVLATAEKNDLQAQESERKQAVPKTNRGKKTTTGTQSPALSRGWATDRSRTGRHKNRRAML